jgi:hypothetical protein
MKDTSGRNVIQVEGRCTQRFLRDFWGIRGLDIGDLLSLRAAVFTWQ